MDGALVKSLLAFRPFRRFVLVTLSGHEYEVNVPEHAPSSYSRW